MMRSIVVLLLLVGTSLANEPVPTGFESWVKAWTSAHDGFVADWWTAEIDEEPGSQRIAKVCRSAIEYKTGDGAYLIEDGSGRRFEIAFEAGRQQCNWNDHSLPPFRRTRDHTIEHSETARQEAERVEVALRHHRPVIVRMEFDDQDDPKHHRYDWDKLCARGKRTSPPAKGRGEILHYERATIHPDGEPCFPDVVNAETSGMKLVE